MSLSNIALNANSIHIREVWSANLEDEFELIRQIPDDFNYISMVTKHPGVVLRPQGRDRDTNNTTDYHYQTLRSNVDSSNLIQLGLTFSDKNGALPTCGTDKYCIWEFNFRQFNMDDDTFSIAALQPSGIDFHKNNEKGIDERRFGELLTSSGIVLNDGVRWVTFHGGYDFGYLIKSMTLKPLPQNLPDFLELMDMYFTEVYDIKHLMKFCNVYGELNKLGEILDVERIGVGSQAGSDSLFVASNFRKLRDIYFNGSVQKYKCVLFGLGGSSINN